MAEGFGALRHVSKYLLLRIFHVGDSYGVGASGCAGLADDRDLQKIPLYAHVAALAGTKQPFVLPVPFQNVINGGVFIRSINLRKPIPYFYNDS